MRPHRTHAAPRRPRWRAAILTSAMVALTGAWISGCSVLYDLKTEQCSTDADCDALGGVFTGLACVEHLCQTPPGCDSHGDCIDEFGSGGEPWACIQRECIRMTTPECPVVLPLKNEGWLTALRSDNPVILAGTGVIETAGTLTPGLRNYELALAEVNQLGGIQGGTRPLVMVACDALVDETEVDSIMTHVAQRLKIKGMASAFLAGNLQRAFQNFGQAENMFFMSPLESDPLLATIGDSGLLWHIGPRPEVFGRAYAPLLTRTLAHLGLTENVRVATVVAEDQRFLTTMLSTITADAANYGITFNGGSVADNLGTNYLGLSVTAGEGSSNEEVAALLDFKPHVIISAGAFEFYTNIIAGVESGWDDSDGPRPFYLLSPYNYNDPVSLRAVTNGNSGLRSRLAGVNGAAAEDDTNYRQYLIAYQSHFGFTELGQENYYDAAYYLIYSAAAVAATSALEGIDFTRGMRRLLGGSQTFNVGDAQLAAGLAAVGNGASIQLDGTLGPPTWNEDGTRDLLGSVYCIDSGDNFVGDVLRYREATPGDASSVTLEGDFSCFDFGPAAP